MIQGGSFSHDGAVLAYSGSVRDEWYAVVNDRRIGPFEFLQAPVVSRDGSTVAFLAEDEEGSLVVIGGERRPVADGAMLAFLSRDGKRLGLVMKEGDYPRFRCWIEVEGRRTEEFEWIESPEFDPRGEGFTFRAKLGGREVVVVGDRLFEAEGIVAGPYFQGGDDRIGFGIKRWNELIWREERIRLESRRHTSAPPP